MKKNIIITHIFFILMFLSLIFCPASILTAAGLIGGGVTTNNDGLGEKQNELDNNITGIIMMPTPFKQDQSSGLNLDFSLTNIIGEVTGTHKDANSNIPNKRDYTNPVLMSLVTLTGKWTFVKEQRRTPAIALGPMYTLALNLGDRINTEIELSRPTNAYGMYLNFGKTLINKNSRVVLGYVLGNYSRIFSNLTHYYYPKSGNILYTGIDLNLKKFGMYFEILKPMESEQNPIIFNVRFKNIVPTLVLSYITTKGFTTDTSKISGVSSLLAIIHLRIPLYPPYEKGDIEDQKQKIEEKEKYKDWQNKIKNLDF